MESHADAEQPAVTGGLVALALVLIVILAGGPPARATRNRTPTHQVRVACVTTTQQPDTVIRAWLRTYVSGFTSPCRLSAAGYHPTEPPLRYGQALVYLLGPESQPRHRLYLVFLITRKRAARYLLDLHPDPQGRWLVDLWAEL
jgi:hypothetical protein